MSPVWSPDGARIAFQSSRSHEPIALRQTLSSEPRMDELLLEGPGNFTMTPSGWSADARFIAYTTRGSNVSVLPLFGDRKPFAFAATPFIEGSAVFSPDGRYIAYVSNENGQSDVYVQSFPGPGAKSQVSRDGGAILCGERTVGNCSISERTGRSWRSQSARDVHSMRDSRRPFFPATHGDSRLTRFTP